MGSAEKRPPGLPILWRNVPIPEIHVLVLLAGLTLDVLSGWRLPLSPLLGYLLGWPLAAAGVGLAAWAVWTLGRMDVSAPDRVVETGPYAYSRHPMYVGWTLLYLGAMLVLRSLWLLALAPVLLAALHFLLIPAEERRLESAFGAAYRAYRRRVRCYL